MAKANKSTGQHCINVANGKGSYLLLKGHGVDFPDPTANTLDAIVRDINNDFTFAPTVIPQSNPRRLALKLFSNLPAGAGSAPTDGLLTITLVITSNTTSTTTTQPVSDVPVDYINDPTGPPP
jgi:hypothetical protein